MRNLRTGRNALLVCLTWALCGRAILLFGAPASRRSGEIPWQETTRTNRKSPSTISTTSRKLPRASAEEGEMSPADRSDPSDDTATAIEDAAKEQSTDWWKKDAEQTVTNPEQSAHGQGVSPRGEIIQSTQILAVVGTQPVLAGDLLGRINELLEPYVGQATEEQLDQQRWLLMERLLPAALESKMVYQDFIRKLDTEKIESIRVSVYKQFDEKQLPRLVEQAKVATAADLDARLRSLGSSLENTRRAFFEQVAAREMIRRESGEDDTVTHDELLAYYQEHLSEYDVKARAKWEHLMTRFDRFPGKREARQALAAMGNRVLNGAQLSETAKKSSQGPTAQEGGVYDWTTQGSLASRVLDQAIFSLPIGEMSEILEDETGLHIVRVIEREDAGRVSFLKAQVGIRDKIKEERHDEKVKAYLERLKRETYVWNYFEDSTRVAERRRDDAK